MRCFWPLNRNVLNGIQGSVGLNFPSMATPAQGMLDVGVTPLGPKTSGTCGLPPDFFSEDQEASLPSRLKARHPQVRQAVVAMKAKGNHIPVSRRGSRGCGRLGQVRVHGEAESVEIQSLKRVSSVAPGFLAGSSPGQTRRLL